MTTLKFYATKNGVDSPVQTEIYSVVPPVDLRGPLIYSTTSYMVGSGGTISYRYELNIGSQPGYYLYRKRQHRDITTMLLMSTEPWVYLTGSSITEVIYADNIVGTRLISIYTSANSPSFSSAEIALAVSASPLTYEWVLP